MKKRSKFCLPQVASEEYTSKSDVVNDLIRKAREIERIRAKLIQAEQSGFTGQTREEILAEIKDELRRNGKLQERFDRLAEKPYSYPAVDDIRERYRRSVFGGLRLLSRS